MQNGPMTKEQTGFSFKHWLMFAVYPVLKTLTVPPMQPLAKIAVEQQKSATSSRGLFSFMQAFWHIYQTRGLRGFYAGTAASMTREGLKSTYKGPLQVFANDFAANTIPAEMKGSYFCRGIIAGCLVGFFDPTIAGPVERYKTFSITHDTKTSFFEFAKHIYAQQPHQHFWGKMFGFINEIYRGLGVTMGKQTLMNVAFFTTKPWADNMVKPYKGDYPLLSIVWTSLAPGMSAALVGAPLDVLKTLIQRHTGEKKGAMAHLQLVLQQSGWRGLLAGVPARLVLISTGYGFTAFCLNIFEDVRSSARSSVVPDASVELLAEKIENLSLNASDTIIEQQKKPLMISAVYASTNSHSFPGSDSIPNATEELRKRGIFCK
jgi:hypothetical protein